jgi:hypothetical protein
MHFLPDRERSSFALQRASGYCYGLCKSDEGCAVKTQSSVLVNPVMRGLVLQTVALRERNGVQRKTVLRGIP